jgi:hypothetical protein
MKWLLIIIISHCITLCVAQVSFSTTSNTAWGTDGSGSYTIGQLTYHIYSIGEIIVAEGVQQPYEIFNILGIEALYRSAPETFIYPNPVTSSFILNMKMNKNENCLYKIFDLSGRLLETKELDNCNTTINIEEFSRSVYLLKVYCDNSLIMCHKIIKR